MNFHFQRVSGNKKTGPIPTVMISNKSCPSACALKLAGCYGKYGPLGMHWNKVTNSTIGNTFKNLLSEIQNLPYSQIWRYAVVGDLPGINNTVSHDVIKLAEANKGKRGFTYTHKPIDYKDNLELIYIANSKGFTINLSSDNLQDADYKASVGMAPVCTILPKQFGPIWKKTYTPEKRLVIQCLAEYNKKIQCINCGGDRGPLCQRRDRDFIVGFTAHGIQKTYASIVASKGLPILQQVA